MRTLADDRQNDDLDRRIADAKAQAERAHPAPIAGEGAAENRGWAIGIEFVGSVLVGALIGYFLDKWLHTAPWLMIVFLLLGFGAGLRRAIATSNRFGTNLNNDAK